LFCFGLYAIIGKSEKRGEIMIDKTFAYLTDQDLFAAIDYLNQQDGPLAVINTYSQLVRRLYWEEKNLPAVIAIALAGIQYGLMASGAASHPDTAVKIKSVAKGLAYDLASFTWPGWDESGIEIGSSDLAIGLEAAKANLRFAKELDKGDLPLSRAYWMLGGHHLASSNLSEAAACFNKAEEYAATAKAEADRLLAQGFSLVTTMLASPGNADTQNQLAQVKDQLAQLEHGEGFISQIDTAWGVFSK